MERATAGGVSLVSPGGLLAGITRAVLESALDGELDAHLDAGWCRRDDWVVGQRR